MSMTHDEMRSNLTEPTGGAFTPQNYRDYVQTLCLIDIAENLGIVAEELSAIADSLGAEVEVDSGVAVSAKLNLGGSQMPGQINVDTTNETVALDFYDDKGNVTEAPEGAVVAFSSDNETVATIATDPANPLQGDISPVGVGTANIGATVTGVNEPDGSPFTVPTVPVTVSPGPAESAGLVLSA